MAHVVVVGAGQAGSAVVAKLRGLGFDGQITLIGEEPAPPYQRPPLSKAYLMGEMEEERLWLRSNAFYAEQNITLRLSAKVGGIDRAAKTVSVGDVTLSYDHLVLTTGSTPRRLPAAIGGDLAGVYTVRTLADVDAMRAEFQPGRRVVIVGDGALKHIYEKQWGDLPNLIFGPCKSTKIATALLAFFATSRTLFNLI